MSANMSAATPTRTFFNGHDYHDTLADLLFVYWWAVALGGIVLLSVIKHTLMCWELRQDRHRLECCYIRHCQLRRAAQESKGSAADLGLDDAASASPETSTTTRTPTSGTPARSVAAEPPSKTAAPAEPHPTAEKRRSWVSPLSLAPMDAESVKGLQQPSKKAESVENSPVPSSRARLPSRPGSRLAAEAFSPSLQLPLSSTSGSDLSFTASPLATAPPGTSATTRLLTRFSFMSTDANIVTDDSLDQGPQSTTSDVLSRLNNCCPRYSEDEQRRIDEKRQANVRAWMEAKRALESTENIAAGSCGCTPHTSVTRRTVRSPEGVLPDTELTTWPTAPYSRLWLRRE